MIPCQVDMMMVLCGEDGGGDMLEIGIIIAIQDTITLAGLLQQGMIAISSPYRAL